jgi:hypothetical protein
MYLFCKLLILIKLDNYLMSQRNDNFIDKTFTVLADILIKVLPASKMKKKHFRIIGMECQLNLVVIMLRHWKIIMKL